MIILGIDPGTTRIGYSLLKKENIDDIRVLNYGCLEILNKTQVARLKDISNFINELISEYRPEILAIEQLFFTKNTKTALSVAEARGVIINTAAFLNLEVLEFTPLEVKLAVTGYGKAEKRYVQKMVMKILKLQKMPKPDDAADAIAIGLTACYTNPKLKS